MKKKPGPSKKLAPSIDRESSCPHFFSDDECVQLEIDCSECAGAHELGNPVCFSRVMVMLSSGTSADAIILKRTIHKRYRGGAVEAVNAAAAELARINRALSTARRPSDKRCRTCPASAVNFLELLRKSLVGNPVKHMSRSESDVSSLSLPNETGLCEKSAQCTSDSMKLVAAIER